MKPHATQTLGIPTPCISPLTYFRVVHLAVYVPCSPTHRCGRKFEHRFTTPLAFNPASRLSRRRHHLTLRVLHVPAAVWQYLLIQLQSATPQFEHIWLPQLVENARDCWYSPAASQNFHDGGGASKLSRLTVCYGLDYIASAQGGVCPSLGTLRRDGLWCTLCLCGSRRICRGNWQSCQPSVYQPCQRGM